MRALPLGLGAAALALAWLGPLPRLAPGAFSAHMTMHMAAVAVAAPLIAVGLAGGALDPARRWPLLFAPLPASVVELVAVWGWHAPALHHLARHSLWGLVAEQATFLGSGLWVWLAAVGGQGRERTGAGVVALLLTSMHMTLLGALLALASRPLYAHAAAGALSPLDDQHLGGAIMLVVGGVAYLTGGVWLMARLVRTRALGRGT